MDASLIVVAAGNSSRMDGVNKQVLILNDNKPVIAHTLQAFADISEITEIIIVTRKDDILLIGDIVKEFGISKVKAIVPGGNTRQESVFAGLKHVDEEKVLIHDGARPFVSKDVVDDLLMVLSTCDAVIPGVPVKDTIKRRSVTGEVLETVPRDDLVAIQTPQGFTTQMIISAHQRAMDDGVAVTDDASVAEYAGISVRIVKGDYQNIKITTPEDVLIANTICMGR